MPMTSHTRSLSSLAAIGGPAWVVRVGRWYQRVAAGLDRLQPLTALCARLFVGQAFFLSGLTKLRDWDTTLALFTDEYRVPWLSPESAALWGTGGELVLPVLLVLGLGGRFAAVGLSVVNVVAVLSLPEIAPAALRQHQLWGALLVGVAVYGAGRWSLDAWWTTKAVRR